jgi:hypothetical protein
MFMIDNHSLIYLTQQGHSYCILFYIYVFLKNSLIIHEEKTKEITTVSVVLYVIKNNVNVHKL